MGKKKGGTKRSLEKKDREMDRGRVGSGPGGFNDFARRLLGPQGSRCSQPIAGDNGNWKSGTFQSSVVRRKEGAPLAKNGSTDPTVKMDLQKVGKTPAQAPTNRCLASLAQLIPTPTSGTWPTKSRSGHTYRQDCHQGWGSSLQGTWYKWRTKQRRRLGILLAFEGCSRC